MESQIVKKVSDDIIDIIFTQFPIIRNYKKKGKYFYVISIRTAENMNPEKVFENIVQIVSQTEENTNILNFDKDNYINIANGCIFDKNTFEINGYD